MENKIDLSDEQIYNTIDSAIDILSTEHPEFEEEHTTGWDFMESLKLIREGYKCL